MADKIRLYGTGWCPDTARSKRCLGRLGIDYDWIDIDEDEEGCDFVLQVNKGHRSVPTILFPDGSVMVEPGDAELESRCRGFE